jgi:hypothetical protein
MSELSFFSNGKRIEIDTIKNYEWLAVGYDWNNNNVHAFESRDAFIKSIQNTKFGSEMSRIFSIIDEAKKYENEDNSLAIQRQRKFIKRTSDDLKELSKRTRLTIGSEELFERAAIKSHILEGKILNSALLFENYNCSGRFLPIPANVPQPSFDAFNFDNIASSGLYQAILCLWEKSWFKGTAISFCHMNPFWPARFNLQGWWNDKASSCYLSGF